jgi:tetratricopeptide (TPR) repeat protein
MPSSGKKIIASHSGAVSNHEIISELKKIRAQLERKPAKKWYDKLYNVAILFAKYVGIPGVIIAAIGPTQKLASDLIEHQNKALIERVYLDYASGLLAEGSIDRANRLLATLEAQKDFDARLQYYKAKTLIAMAIQQGRNYTEAFDTASILTKIADQRTPFFPSLGATDDLIELNLALVDIDTAQQNYSSAKEKLTRLENNPTFVKSSILIPNIEYRLGVLDVLQYNFPGAQSHLLKALSFIHDASQQLLQANATFQLAKAYQFNGDHATALSRYKDALRIYESLPDKFGLLRTYNNMAMIFFDGGNDNDARLYYNHEQEIAREVGDDLGYARATVNVALIEKRERNYDISIRLATEALGVFRQQKNLLGITTAATVLASDLESTGNRPEALAYAKENFDATIQLHELRGVLAACGILSNIYADMRDDPEMLFASLCAASLIKQLNINNLPNSGEDYEIFESRIRSVTGRGSAAGALEAAETRVHDIFIRLNLGTETVRMEVANFKN